MKPNAFIFHIIVVLTLIIVIKYKTVIVSVKYSVIHDKSVDR